MYPCPIKGGEVQPREKGSEVKASCKRMRGRKKAEE
jgi:hypothetical protein